MLADGLSTAETWVALVGAGKTLIARQIGKMLNGKEPKIVNGPEVLNKYVGASEENVRNLFKVGAGLLPHKCADLYITCPSESGDLVPVHA